MAHSQVHQAVHEVIEALELVEGLLPMDIDARTALTRKLARAKMCLYEARQDMRSSRLGGNEPIRPAPIAPLHSKGA